VGAVLISPAAMASPEEKIVVADRAGTIAEAGVDPALTGRALQDALLAAIATRGGYCWWDLDHAGEVHYLRALHQQNDEWQAKPPFHGAA
jgi:hypothetical protein